MIWHVHSLNSHLYTTKLDQKTYLLSLIVTLCISILNGCTPSFLSSKARVKAELGLQKQAEKLERDESRFLTPAELVYELYQGVKALKYRVPPNLSDIAVRRLGVRRIGGAKVGDLAIFKTQSHTPSVGVITEVIASGRYRAIVSLRGALRWITIDLNRPHIRRIDHQIINSFIRKIDESDQPPYFYLAGELLEEFRATF